MKNTKYLFLLMIFAIAAILAACSGDKADGENKENVTSTDDGTATDANTESEGGGEGGTLTFALPGDIIALDPAFSYDFATNPVVTQITEGLLQFDENGQLQPLLAESWEAVDPTTYVYQIRDDVNFSDGSPMTIDDVIFSMERTMDPATASYVGWMYSNVESIEATGDWEVTVKLKQPDILWRYAVGTTAGHIISKAYYEKNEANFGKPDGGVMGTGPFEYVEWKTGSEITLKKNENYWNKSGGPYLDKVVYKMLPEGNTVVTGLKTGQVTATINLPLDLIEVVQAMDNVNIDAVDSYMSNFVAINVEREPLNDVNVRKAMNYALDKQKIMEKIVKDSGSPAKAVPVGPALWIFNSDLWEQAYEELPGYEYDIEKAKEYLAKSSVPDGFSATIMTESDTLKLNTALALQAAVKPLGINLEIEKVTTEEANTRAFGNKDYDMMMQTWGADFPDAVGNLQPVFHSSNSVDGGSNFSKYSNAEVDKYMEEQVALTDDKERTELMIKAQKIIAEDTPWIMIDHPKQMFVANTDVDGYTMKPMWYWDSFLKDVKFK